MALTEALASQTGWEGSLDELTYAAGGLLRAQDSWHGRELRAPTRSRVVDYRNVGLISPALRKRYHWRHLVQLVVACVLVQDGEHRETLARRFADLTTDDILGLLDENAAPAGPGADATPVASDEARALALASAAIPLLAAGLVAQYRRARDGKPLRHDDETLSPWLLGAMSRLASLHLLYGLEVKADGVHTLVAQCCHPLRAREWRLPIFDAPEFHYHGIHLLDTTTRLPTIECLDLARGLTSELDLLEHQAFAQLNACCDLFGPRGAEVYTALREFIVRQPITTVEKQRKYLTDRSMLLAAPFLAFCYEQVQPHHLVRGSLHPCTRCRAPMVAAPAMVAAAEHYLACPVRQCPAFDIPVLADKAPRALAEHSFIAKAALLTYWFGPGLDEIALYDAARTECPERNPRLYPDRDACDISLDEDNQVGIDVKSHANPFLLANTLNLGGLERFATKCVAVNDQALSRFPGYLDILRREYRHTDVMFLPVSALLRTLKRGP